MNDLLRASVMVALAAAVGSSLPAQAQAQDAVAASPPAASALTSAAGAGEPDPARGRRAYQRNCSVCHGLRGEGGLGPALGGIARRRTADEIAQQIKSPVGAMPRLYPSPIDDRQLLDLQAYLKQLS